MSTDQTRKKWKNSIWDIEKPLPDSEVSLCTVCKIEHFQNYELFRNINECMHPEQLLGPHKKPWEWGMGLYALRRLGMIADGEVADLHCLGVGSGVELIQYILTNYVRQVTGTDLFSMRSRQHQGFGDPDFKGILLGDVPKDSAAGLLYRLPWHPDRINHFVSDGTNLKEVPTDSVDVVFTFSSIEHFLPLRVGGGRHEGTVASMNAISRVLKPGGIALISTEWNVLPTPDAESYRQQDMQQDFYDCSPLKMVCDMDWEVDEILKDKENWNSVPENIRLIEEARVIKKMTNEEADAQIAALGGRKDVGHNVISAIEIRDGWVALGSLFLTMRNDK